MQIIITLKRLVMHPFVPDSIEKEFIEFEKIFKNVLKNDNLFIHNLLSYISTEQGKQIRPILVLLSAAMNGKINPKTHLIASILELLHVSSLIHDDVIDNADKRRNHLTVNARWNNKTAVLLGDYLLAKCMQLLQSSDDSTLSNYIALLVQKMTEGEILQLSNIHCYHTTEEEYYGIIASKTASLFGAALFLGACSVNADKDTSLRLQQAGVDIGMAFQIKDDLKDYNKTLKDKDFAKDIKEHIVTLPLIYVLQKIKPVEKKALIDVYENHQCDETKMLQIIDIIEEQGGIVYAQTVIESKIHNAIALISKQKESEYSRHLIQLLHQIA